jgi:hypothetical protein
MPRVVGPTSPADLIDINVGGMSPHVVAYKLWWRDAAADWTLVGEGSTGDQQPDHFQRPFTTGAQLYYWIGVGGKPNSSYQAIVTLSQGGKVLPNGLVDVSGKTDASGVDTQEDVASFV